MASYATLTVLDMETQRPVLLGASGSVTVDTVYTFSRDVLGVGNRPFAFQRVDDPMLGPGNRMTLHTVTYDGRFHIDLRVSLFANDVILYDIVLPDAESAGQAPVFRHVSFDGNNETLLLAEDAEYVTDFSRLRYGHLSGDGLLRREAVGQGKPIFIWSTRQQRGLLMALLDQTNGPTYFRAQVMPGHAQARWGLRSGAAVQQDQAGGIRSGRLYLEVTKTADLRSAPANLRAVYDEIAPEVPLPPWYKFQWLSWYVYGMGNHAATVQRQADYIRDNCAFGQ